MKLMTKVLSAAMLVGGIAVAATPAFAYPARSEAGVNVRSGPGTQYDVVDQLSPGEGVNVANRNGGWCQISGGGWVSCNYLSGSGGAVAYNDGPYYGNSYYDDPYYDGPAIGLGIGLGFGDGYGYGHGHHWNGHGGHGGHRLWFPRHH